MEHDSQLEVYFVHVGIREIHPMLWRRFLVRSDSTLADLHVILLSCPSESSPGCFVVYFWNI